MALIRNLTTDTLGWRGQTITAGGTLDVPDEQAREMVERCPDKYEVIVDAPPKADVREAPTKSTSKESKRRWPSKSRTVDSLTDEEGGESTSIQTEPEETETTTSEG